jgi:hypothetical protein
MLKLSTIDKRSERRLIVEGKLVEPWVEELRKAWISAGENLEGRKLVIDLSNATVIGREGEDALFELMRDGAKFSCCGVLTKYVIRRLVHKCHSPHRDVNRTQASGSKPANTGVPIAADKQRF